MDYKFIRDNRDLVIKNLKDRNYAALEPTVDEIISLYKQKTETALKIANLNKTKKELAAARNIEQGKQLRIELQATEHHLDKVPTHLRSFSNINQLEDELYKYTVKIPNVAHPDVPTGEPKQLKLVGSKREFSFPFKDHLTLGKKLDIIDFESAALTTGIEISSNFHLHISKEKSSITSKTKLRYLS